MFKQYIKQAFQLLLQNKLLSLISILGTALAICLIMTIFLVYEARTANYEPELNRDRTLSTTAFISQKKEDTGWNTLGKASLLVIKECFYSLTSAEAVTGIIPAQIRLASSPGESTEKKVFVSYTDSDFWKVFQFRFLNGTSYSKEEFESGVKKVVICHSLARKIFGTTDVVGKTLSLSHNDYTICGVVPDVSALAEAAYGEVWAPYTTYTDYDKAGQADGLIGRYVAYILARSSDDFDEIRKEFNRRVDAFNLTTNSRDLVLSGSPDSPLMSLARVSPFENPNVKRFIIYNLIIILISLLVPSINLSGITISRMHQRMEEVGIRRTFGATRTILLIQILTENLLITLLGGILGLIFSYIAVLSLREWLLNTSFTGGLGLDIAVNADMIFKPEVFFFALFFCLILNLLSIGIPAYRLSRANIIFALTH